MDNSYQALKAANDCIKEINLICKALNITMGDLGISPMQKLVIQGFLIQILESTQTYTEAVKPMIEGKQ